jgi:hypothetical protein
VDWSLHFSFHWNLSQGLIHRRGYSAFIGVDEYDAPANACLTSALSIRENLSERKSEIEWLEYVLKAEFFGVIKRACGESVQKYWLTGVLPAFWDGISPPTATCVISFDSQYQSLCGFTQEDVKAIVSRALHHFPEKEQDLALTALKRWYNGYKFCPAVVRERTHTQTKLELTFFELAWLFVEGESHSIILSEQKKKLDVVGVGVGVCFTLKGMQWGDKL